MWSKHYQMAAIWSSAYVCGKKQNKQPLHHSNKIWQLSKDTESETQTNKRKKYALWGSKSPKNCPLWGG